MKLKHLFLILSTVSLLIVISCKKDKDELPLTTAQKIQAKWQIDNFIYRIYSGSYGIDNSDTTKGQPPDYVDFRSDGKVYVSFDGDADTSNYTVQGDTKIIIDVDEAYEIRNLTDHTLTLYAKDSASSDEYEEITFNLKK